MKKFLLSISIFSVAGLAFSQQPCTDLFFSEYIEGTSNNKAFEVYNPTTDTVDLSAYYIYRYTNAATVQSDTLYMTGMLAPGETYNVVNPSADSLNLEIYADTTHTITFYNGDDPLYLFNSGTLIDVIGVASGTDPGTNWPVDTGATSEYTLVRKPNIHAGTTTWIGVGDTTWIVYAQNDFTHFNAHTMNACPAGSGIDNEISWEMNLYPNPTSGILNIITEVNNYSLKILDITGKAVITKNSLSESAQIDLTHLHDGIYLINVFNGVHQTTKKVILKK